MSVCTACASVAGRRGLQRTFLAIVTRGAERLRSAPAIIAAPAVSSSDGLCIDTVYR
jgi:hypothetical protein